MRTWLSAKTVLAVSIGFIMLLFFSNVAFTGSILGLKIGKSTKQDADRILGKPIKEMIKGVKYEYPPQQSARRILLTFYRDTGIVRAIDIYPQEPYVKAEYQEWLNLKAASRTSRDKQNRLIEYYPEKGIALHFAGPDDTSTVMYISHYDTSQPITKKVAKGQRKKDYYVQESDRAIKEKDWKRAKSIIEKGLHKYPNSSRLWHNRVVYYFNAKDEPLQVRKDEAMQSMSRAYELNPSGKNAAEMGWLHFRSTMIACWHCPILKKLKRKATAREPRVSFIGWPNVTREEASLT